MKPNMEADWKSRFPEPDWVSPCGNAILYQRDCLSILPEIPDGSVDAVVTDPPYGISHRCNFNGRGRSVLAECNDYPDVHCDDQPYDPQPLLGLSVPTVLWGGNHFSSRLPDASGWLVWDKERPDELDQATCELAWTNCVKGVRRFRHLWNGMMRASERGENYHPTQKPVSLYDWVFRLRWIPSGVVLDPYMGSAPCAVAALRLGRKFIGCEIEKSYFDIACQRIANEHERFSLFNAAKETQSELFTENP